MVTQALLHELFEYKEDGNLYWKVSRSNKIVVGTIAGTLHKGKKTTYRRIQLDTTFYLAHRLVWLYHHGVWPLDKIDHADTNGLNNRLDNLREATNQQNAQNTTIQSNNTTGYKGVSWMKSKKKFKAYINVNGKQKHLGLFDTVVEAAHKYQEVAKMLHGKYYRE